MDLQDSLRKISTEWVKETSKQFKDNQLANFVRSDFKITVENIVNDSDFYLIKSSAGAGKWANISWLSILDKTVTKSTQEGVYPVYLFRADGSGVYLSLNQGTSGPINRLGIKEAKKREIHISRVIHSEIEGLNNWSDSSLDLRANTSLGKSYEKSNIAAKFYPIEELPSSKLLIEDLLHLLTVYENIAKIWPTIEYPNIENGSSQIVSFSCFETDIERSGLIFLSSFSLRYIASLQSKPFIILTGLSGSGKTKLAEAFSLWITESKEQYCMIAVGADWTNREPLLGFPNALEEGKYISPDSGALDLILRAEKDPVKPYFLILDEMNMSHVERYFADFLSAMESTDRIITLHPDTEEWNDCDVPATLKLPENLFIIGTVNIDETTYMFSPKVLDRANVIEFRVSKSEMDAYFDEPKALDMESLRGAGSAMGESFVAKAIEKVKIESGIKQTLMPFFEKLQEAGAEFGYRTAAEISRFVAIYTELADGSVIKENDIIDAAIMQKLLPKLHGSRNKIEKILKALGRLCLEQSENDVFQINADKSDKSDKYTVKYPLSYQKLKRMHERVIADGFTSFAEA